MSAPQKWTAEHIPDLTGKVVVVTGANSGIGWEAVRQFARKGADTILACRSAERGRRAVDELRAEYPRATVELMLLDLASLASIERFSQNLTRARGRLDTLVNNAGIMAVPYSITEDGFESQMGINHLGHFALTGRLLENLLSTPGSRVVTVSSIGHRGGRLDFDNLQLHNGGYTPFRAYWNSKLANLLFTYELHRRLDSAAVPVLALAAHPGLAPTNIGGHLGSHWYSPLQRPLLAGLSHSASRGALPTVRAATDPQARGGQYYGPSGLTRLRGHPVVVTSNAASHNREDSRRLWEASEKLTGVRFWPLS